MSTPAPQADFNVLRWFAEEVINHGDFSHYARWVSVRLVDHDVFPGEPEGNYERLRQVVQDIRTTMPDIHFALHSEAVVGQRHFARFRATGTMTGPLLGKEPTGKHAEWWEMHEALVDEEGKMVEHWGLGDELRRLVELGLIEF